ncbi:MAG: hypothetical protein JWO31_1679 [Phycisphaerales bacterium]|nr:hypothetical protein [Phycisphaerales bacterium]
MRIGLHEFGQRLTAAWRSTGRRYVGGVIHGVWIGLVCGYLAGTEFGPLPRKPWVDLTLAIATALALYVSGVIAADKPERENRRRVD